MKGKSLLSMVTDSDVDAAFVNQPRTEQARRMGLKVIDIPAQDMIFFMTISSSAKMVTERPDVVKRVLKSVLEGIAYFKQNKHETIKILMAKHKKEGDLDLEMATKVYDDLAPRLEPQALSEPGAVYNVYQEALKQDEKNGDAAKIHPLALWNMNFLREIDDTGFINKLYKKNPQMLNGYGGWREPEQQAAPRGRNAPRPKSKSGRAGLMLKIELQPQGRRRGGLAVICLRPSCGGAGSFLRRQEDRHVYRFVAGRRHRPVVAADRRLRRQISSRASRASSIAIFPAGRASRR